MVLQVVWSTAVRHRAGRCNRIVYRTFGVRYGMVCLQLSNLRVPRPCSSDNPLVVVLQKFLKEGRVS